MIETLFSMIEAPLSVLREVLSSVEFWKLAVPVFSAIVAWLVNEWRKRLWEEYKRKEDSYSELLRCLRGFYMGQHHSLRITGTPKLRAGSSYKIFYNMTSIFSVILE
ncbi:MAG: hypothetical protein ACI9SP_002454 [Arenicella sp.]|jgi:hypothetical protein